MIVYNIKYGPLETFVSLSSLKLSLYLLSNKNRKTLHKGFKMADGILIIVQVQMH